MSQQKSKTRRNRPSFLEQAQNILAHPALWLIPAIALFAYICWRFHFVQDDAFITYRYVVNALNGHGLVYNIGERIEGYTNLGWVIFLLAAGKLGLSIIDVSRGLGFLCGIGCIIVTWRLARLVLAERHAAYAGLAVLLLAINGAFAYWSPAGLETACFGLLAALALLFFLQRNWLLIAALAALVWVRPDGAVVAGLLLIIEAVTERRFPRFTAVCIGAAFLASLPMLGFKLGYYGSILPNPFYAKTSLNLSQFSNGLNYTWEYLLQYGFLGLTLLIPVLYYRRLDSAQRSVLLFVLGFILYVVVIGGDVLKVNRFFLPIFGPAAILTALTVSQLLRPLSPKLQGLIATGVALLLFAITWIVPYKTINGFLDKERGLVDSMSFQCQRLLSHDRSDFSVATSTIGALGYALMGHRVIDMVGLTDSTIARHPQAEIPGITSTWRESKYNAGYVISQSPDYFIFSTGMKPSSPGEQALFLYDAFLDSYRAITVARIPMGEGKAPRPCIAYRRVRAVTGPIAPTHPVTFVTALKRGQESATEGKFDDALRSFLLAEVALGGRQYPDLMSQEAACLLELGQTRNAFLLMDSTLAVDSAVVWPHRDLYMTAAVQGDTAKAEVHRRWLEKLSPEDLQQAIETIRQHFLATRRSGK